ncbi:MAG: hypothetical protein M3Y87_37365, partial [Myxococcota bacterium]|nr:hypothetical protein [Myxococcota bacterium]
MRWLGWMGCLGAIAVASPALAQDGREASVELRCSLGIQPFVSDPRTGERMPATPERFELRPVGEGARVDAGGDGWTVRAASMRLDYELVERASGRV